MIDQAALENLKTWAISKRDINRVWLFNGETLGAVRPENELHIWIDAWKGAYICDSAAWEKELKLIIRSTPIRLVEYQHCNADLRQKLDGKADLIFDRATGTS